jgi:hypothetical protein
MYWDFEYFDRDGNRMFSVGDEFTFYNLDPASYRCDIEWQGTLLATTSWRV